jgi:hypothetical protein
MDDCHHAATFPDDLAARLAAHPDADDFAAAVLAEALDNEERLHPPQGCHDAVK